MKSRILLALLMILMPAVVTDSATSTELRPFTRGSWQELRQAHDGQPMIVHFWGFTCGPCLAELPDWGKFAGAHPGLALVTIADDPVADEKSQIGALRDAGLGEAENWSFADAFNERLRFEVNPHWHGELPYTVFIAADGAVTATSGAVDFSTVRSWADSQNNSHSGP